ncbi:MAG: fumarylacetoacetate hydrolase family protein [Acidobacteria bacterium]|nr:fumarylacetoacetate hydrolase family protein [Acidobacteriota bacterium]
MQESIKTTRRQVLAGALATSLEAAAGQPKKYVRFRKGMRISYGLLEGDTIQELRGTLFAAPTPAGAQHKLADVKLLYPVTPSKILALAGNYRSHMGGQTPPSSPEPFYKPVSCLISPEEPIMFPKGATVVHPECELVIVMGRRAANVSVAQAKEAIFGVTCGNDVSEREWQNGSRKDIQWWRAKGADTFGPLGPAIVTGLDYGNLEIQSRINGKVIQKDSTSQLVHDCPSVVSYISRYVTLLPGDLIFTGTPGKTSPMHPGDVVEVEIQGIGILRNKVTQA